MMRWHSQVLHVVRKDLRLARWMILTYAAIVAAATAGAIGWDPIDRPSLLLMISLILMGVLLLARLVQADSPVESNAFWATLPLSRSAMFAAKVAGAVLFVLVLPLLGQLAGLRAHAVEGRAVPGMLAESALAYGLWMGTGAVLAALTRDLRTFLLTFLLVVLGWVIGVQILLSLTSAEPLASSAGLAPAVIIIVGALLILGHQYRSRDVRRGVWMAAIVGTGALVASIAQMRAAPAAAPGGLPAHLRPAVLRVDSVRVHGDGTALVNVRFEGFSESHEYWLLSPAGRIRMRDGSYSDVHLDHRFITLNTPRVPAGEGMPPGDERRSPDGSVMGYPIDLTHVQRDALTRGEATLEVRGRLHVREARVKAELPVYPGSSVATRGHRVRVLDVNRSGAGPLLNVRVSSVAAAERSRGQFQEMFRSRSPRYLLVNRSRGESIELSEHASSTSDAALVLPGPHALSQTAGLRHHMPAGEPELTPEWLAQAHLLLVDWVPVGSETVVLESTRTPAGG